MKKLLSLSAVAVAALAFAGAAHAQTIVSVQFPQYYSGLASPLNGQFNYSAGAGTPVQNWNMSSSFTNGGPGSGGGTQSNATLLQYVSGNTYTHQSSVLVDSTGAATTDTFTETNGTNNDHGDDNNIPGPQPNYATYGALDQNALATGVTFSNSATAPVTLTFGGLNLTDTYNLTAYVNSAWYYFGNKFSVSLGATTYFLTADNSVLTGLTQSTSQNPLVSPNADYVTFTGLTGAQLEALPLIITGAGSGISGFQIIDTGAAATPEPSAIWLLSLGLLSVGFFVRRNRAAREI